MYSTEKEWKADQYDSIVRNLKVADGGRYRADTEESILIALRKKDAEIDRLRALVDQRWIPVGERLPKGEEPIEVNVWDDYYKVVRHAEFIEGKFWRTDADECEYEIDATHWQPLPPASSQAQEGRG